MKDKIVSAIIAAGIALIVSLGGTFALIWRNDSVRQVELTNLKAELASVKNTVAIETLKTQVAEIDKKVAVLEATNCYIHGDCDDRKR